MALNLSLVYNSQGGNGLAGEGWELGGLSMIHRCPKTRPQDGDAKPVEMKSRDEDEADPDGICLDGKRLFKTSPTTYEAESTDFATITRILPVEFNDPDPFGP